MTEKINKHGMELAWANHAAREYLPLQQAVKFEQLKSTLRTFVTAGRPLLVWTVRKGEPQALYAVTAYSLDVDFGNGARVVMLTPHGKVTVTHAPTKLPDVDAYIWVPMFAELRYAAIDYEDVTAPRSASIPLCVKIASNYSTHLVEGDVYVCSPAQFKAQFPNHKNLQF